MPSPTSPSADRKGRDELPDFDADQKDKKDAAAAADSAGMDVEATKETPAAGAAPAKTASTAAATGPVGADALEVALAAGREAQKKAQTENGIAAGDVG